MEKCNICGKELENIEALKEHIKKHDVTWAGYLEDYKKHAFELEGGEKIVREGRGGLGKKWYMIGIGGAGGRIIDAIVMRRDQLKHRKEELVQIWEEGLEDHAVLNTNLAETMKLYIMRNKNEKEVRVNHIFSETGGGGVSWKGAEEAMREEVKDDAIMSKLKRERIANAQGILVTHSVTKGTGCGASPALVPYIKNTVLKDLDAKSKPIISVTVLPKRSELRDGRSPQNGIIGFAKIAKVCDAVIIFDNSSLIKNKNNGQAIINGIEGYNRKYGKYNHPLVSFLEGFTISSIPMESGIVNGDVFDIPDSINIPREQRSESSTRMGIIFAPVYGKYTGDRIDEGAMEVLLINTLLNGRLVDFDPKTAIGGSFLFYGPESKIEQVEELIDMGTFNDIIRGSKFLNAIGTTMPIKAYTISTSFFDDVYLWGILWDPEVRILKQMRELSEEYMKMNPHSKETKYLKEVWDDVKAVFNNMGRERYQ